MNDFSMGTYYPLRSIKSLVKINYGKGLAAKVRDEKGEVPVYGSNGIIGYHSESITRSPAIIIGRKGSVGAVNFSSTSCWPIDTSFFIDEYPDDLDPKWLYYCLTSLEFGIHAQGPKPGIKRDLLYQTEIPVPPLAEQRRIVARIEELTRRAVEARGLRQEAVEEIANLFQIALKRFFSPQAMGDWYEYEARQVFDIVRGQVDPRKKPYIDLPHVAPNSIESGTGRLLKNLVKTPRDLRLRSGKYHFNSSHVLYSKIRPNLRKVVLPDFEGTCSADMYPLIPNTEVVSREFLVLTLLAPPFSHYAVENSDRNAMPKINRSTMLGYRMKLPSIEVQREIISKVKQIQTKADKITALQNKAASKIEQFQPALLAKVFRGTL